MVGGSLGLVQGGKSLWDWCGSVLSVSVDVCLRVWQWESLEQEINVLLWLCEGSLITRVQSVGSGLWHIWSCSH